MEDRANMPESKDVGMLKYLRADRFREKTLPLAAASRWQQDPRCARIAVRHRRNLIRTEFGADHFIFIFLLSA